jgi:ribosomal protein L9
MRQCRADLACGAHLIVWCARQAKSKECARLEAQVAQLQAQVESLRQAAADRERLLQTKTQVLWVDCSSSCLNLGCRP